MTDNATLNSMSGGIKAATREIAYSGETAHAQAMGLVVFSGADDAKTAADVTQANPLPVYDPDLNATGTMLLLNDAIPITLNGDGSWSTDLSGFSGHVVTFESQVNSATPWRPINGALQGVGTLSTTATADGTYRGAAAALAGIRVRLSTLGTGMVTAYVRAGANTGGVFLMAPATVTGPGGAALALDGTDISAPTAMPAGGVGIRGWLSSIWTKLNGILSVVITSNGLISANNSSATPLGVGGVLTCTSDDVTEWGEARVSVFTDQAGATDGFQMQQSSNNVNWDVSDSYTIPASAGKTFSVALSLKHFRVVNTNGGVAQGVMRLQTKYFKSYNKSSSVRPQDARTNDNDFEEVLTHQMGYDSAAGNWNRLRSTIANGLAVDVTRQPTLTKGTQGATGVTTQDLKDAGRVNVAMTCYQAAGILTTEALFAAGSFSISRDGAAASTGVQLAVTAGKRFRLQSIVIGVKNTAAAAGTSKLVLRYAAAGGTITNASPILAILDIGSNSAVANAYIGPTEMALPDGIELLGGSTCGFTNLSGAVTMLHTISLNGYEY